MQDQGADKQVKSRKDKEAKHEFNSKRKENMDKLKTIWERARAKKMPKEERASMISKLMAIIGNEAKG